MNYDIYALTECLGIIFELSESVHSNYKSGFWWLEDQIDFTRSEPIYQVDLPTIGEAYI